VSSQVCLQLARTIRRDQERMAKFLTAELGRLVKQLVRAEIPHEQRAATSRSRARRSTSRSRATTNRATANRSRAGAGSTRSRSGAGTTRSRSGGASQSSRSRATARG
jgi:hypothetical protein